MAYSTDGISWTAVTLPGNNAASRTWGSVASLAWGNNRFVAGFDYGAMAYSADGVTWTAVSNTTFPSSGYGNSMFVRGIAYGSGRFVAVGDNGRMAYCNW